MREDVGEPIAPAIRTGAPQPQEHVDTQPVEAASEEAEPAGGGGVDPLDVVQAEDERTLSCEVGRQPVQAVQHGMARITAGRPDRIASDHGLGQARCVTEQPRPLVPASGCQRRLEELPYQSERVVPLELVAPGAQDADAVTLRRPRRLERQACLADA